MTLEITQIKFSQGVWQGLISGAAPGTDHLPKFDVTLHEEPVDTVQVIRTQDTDELHLQITIPPSAVGSGVHSFVITEHQSLDVLARFTLIGGGLGRARFASRDRPFKGRAGTSKTGLSAALRGDLGDQVDAALQVTMRLYWAMIWQLI